VTRFAFVEAEKALFPVVALCQLLTVSRSGYYTWATRAPSARAVADEVLTTQIQTIFATNRKVHGAPRIHAELTEAGANTISRIKADGTPKVISYVPNETSGALRDATPTCITEGPDGALYIGTLDLLSNFAAGSGLYELERGA
jgi:hypothetical protein